MKNEDDFIILTLQSTCTDLDKIVPNPKISYKFKFTKSDQTKVSENQCVCYQFYFMAMLLVYRKYNYTSHKNHIFLGKATGNVSEYNQKKGQRTGTIQARKIRNIQK